MSDLASRLDRAIRYYEWLCAPTDATWTEGIVTKGEVLDVLRAARLRLAAISSPARSGGTTGETP